MDFILNENKEGTPSGAGKEIDPKYTIESLDERVEKFLDKDGKYKEAKEKIDKIEKEIQAIKISKEDLENAVSIEAYEYTTEEVRKQADKIKVLISQKQELDNIVESKFGLRELKKFYDDKVENTLSVKELSESYRSEIERCKIRTDNGSNERIYGKRRVILTHPKPETLVYKAYKETIKDQIERTRSAFNFRMGVRKVTLKEKLEGRIDRRRLALSDDIDRIYKKVIKKEDVGIAIGVLLDESGSMGGRGKTPTPMGKYGISKAETTLKLGILLVEALKTVPGIEMEVWSHTSLSGNDKDCIIKYLYGKKNKNMQSIAAYNPGRSNYDHIAIQNAGEMLIEDTKGEKKLLLVLSDGQPAGSGYGGESAEASVKRVVKELEAKGVHCIHICIGGYVSTMFKHTVVFKDISTLISDVRKLLLKLVMAETVR
jgi:cobalamin biosynthesis protein CobT